MKRALLISIAIFLAIQVSRPQIKIACIGNSITYGSGMPEPKSMSYPAQLQYWMGSDYEVRNFGVGGRTLLKNGDYPYWEEKEYQEALEFKPDIVLIKLGTNDSKPQNWQYSDEFVQDYLDLIQSFKNLSSRPRILVILPVPVFAEEKWGIRQAVVRDEVIPKVMEVATKSNSELIDLFNPLLESEQFFPDKIHPDPIGASLMTEIIYRKLFHKTPEDNGGYFNPCTYAVPSFEYRPGAGWGDGNYWMSQHEAINEIGKTREVDLVFLGNSITQGWGGEGREVWSPVPELWDSLFKPLNAANFGISGDRTQHILWRVKHGNFDNIKPKLVILTAGVNNFRHNKPEEIAAGIEAIISELSKKLPSSKILLLGPLPAGSDSEDPMRISYERVHQLISGFGNRQNVIYRNIGKAFILESGELDYQLMRSDNVHLAPKGYYAWAENIMPVIEEVFKTK